MRAEETGSARCVELSRNNRSSPDLMIKRRAGAPARAAAPWLRQELSQLVRLALGENDSYTFYGDFSSRFRLVRKTA